MIRAYKFISPRIAVLVTTVDENGNVNAAPFSFVMPVSMEPEIVAFASAYNHHTLANIRKTGEFVVNIANKHILNQLWRCADALDAGENELKCAGLSEVSAKQVKPPRVRECIAWIECKLYDISEIGDHAVIFGRVVCSDARQEYVKGSNLDVCNARVLMHIGGREFTMPSVEIKAKG